MIFTKKHPVTLHGTVYDIQSFPPGLKCEWISSVLLARLCVLTLMVVSADERGWVGLHTGSKLSRSPASTSFTHESCTKNKASEWISESGVFVYFLSPGFATFSTPPGGARAWTLPPLKIHGGLKPLRTQRRLSAASWLRATAVNRARVTGSTTLTALMTQQMLWRRIRPAYTAPQYTSTSHFLTRPHYLGVLFV